MFLLAYKFLYVKQIETSQPAPPLAVYCCLVCCLDRKSFLVESDLPSQLRPRHPTGKNGQNRTLVQLIETLHTASTKREIIVDMLNKPSPLPRTWRPSETSAASGVAEVAILILAKDVLVLGWCYAMLHKLYNMMIVWSTCCVMLCLNSKILCLMTL